MSNGYKNQFSLLNKEIRSLLLKLLDNQNILFKIIIPYLIFILINISLAGMGVIAIIILILFDVMICAFFCDKALKREQIITTMEKIKNGDFGKKIECYNLYADNRKLACLVNTIGDSIKNAVEVSMKDEKLKADLITNVSHDLKTPLTSIINYVELIKREDIENERIVRYVEVLQNKSYKLKKLTEDLLEASKITSGNIKVELTRINLIEFINQTIGEYYERFELSNLEPLFKHEMEEIYVYADPRHLWRVIENLFGNVCKYALTGTCISIVVTKSKDNVKLVISNVSMTTIGLEDYELEERFIRGDASRSTEGTGLGIAIAKSLIKAQGAEFEIRTAGDLFKSIIKFKNYDNQ